jgi:hypothetical protein
MIRELANSATGPDTSQIDNNPLGKGVLPPNTQIQANAILALSQSTTVFINYLASQYVPPSNGVCSLDNSHLVAVPTKTPSTLAKRPLPLQTSSRP